LGDKEKEKKNVPYSMHKYKYTYDVARVYHSWKPPFRTIPFPRAKYTLFVMFSSPVFGVYAPQVSGWFVIYKFSSHLCTLTYS